jgi:hypothetical protein
MEPTGKVITAEYAEGAELDAKSIGLRGKRNTFKNFGTRITRC